jgi:hypothetical protein
MIEAALASGGSSRLSEVLMGVEVAISAMLTAQQQLVAIRKDFQAR